MLSLYGGDKRQNSVSSRCRAKSRKLFDFHEGSHTTRMSQEGSLVELLFVFLACPLNIMKGPLILAITHSYHRFLEYFLLGAASCFQCLPLLHSSRLISRGKRVQYLFCLEPSLMLYAEEAKFDRLASLAQPGTLQKPRPTTTPYARVERAVKGPR